MPNRGTDEKQNEYKELDVQKVGGEMSSLHWLRFPEIRGKYEWVKEIKMMAINTREYYYFAVLSNRYEILMHERNDINII